MTTHSSILAWKIPRTEEPGGLWSTGLQRVRHNCSVLGCMRVYLATELLFYGSHHIWGLGFIFYFYVFLLS